MLYPKIETLYERDPKTFKVTNKLRHPEFDLVKQWLVTEKVAGTNMRIELSPTRISYRGKTETSQMPTVLLDWFAEHAPYEKVAACFDPGTIATIFGEGYGVGIQKGGVYRNEGVAFRIFDVAVIGEEDHVWWLNWDNVRDVALKLDMACVPLINYAEKLGQAVLLHDDNSVVADADKGDSEVKQEGIVCRTDPLLFMRDGSRLMWKLKRKDFA